ncbi:MAG TPA: CDF family Co(II)/Ni(II) efflux transporter DmeF, partial [Steroidobacteraceae bacterium]|nr:CDF family Co(II)/Ni(II) efflux transporter DmeF [Steroidobacteraceae bacterium]
MNIDTARLREFEHSHVFLGAGHEANERKTWAVIALCSVMMVLEIGGGTLFGSLALVADGLHMSTHVAAILIAALAYRFARRHAEDRRFSFGTGKVGDLAGFSSAIILAMIALLVGYEAVTRLFAPVMIRFAEAIPIAALGLAVNIASAWLLSGSPEHDHSHGDGHSHGLGHSHGREPDHAAGGAADVPGELDDGEHRRLRSTYGEALLEIHEVGAPPRFRLRFSRTVLRSNPPAVEIETLRPDGERQLFPMRAVRDYLESSDEIPEPHEFRVLVRIGAGEARYEEETEFVDSHRQDHADAVRAHATHRDHNFRSAFVHVVGDAFVSVLAILGLLAARFLGWVWMDPVMGLIGAAVIGAWAYSLVRDTMRVLVDVTPD